MHQVVHEAPRTNYGPRTLISTGHGRYGDARGFGKNPKAPRGAIALPEAWSTVCPNRITERRKAAGMETVTALQRAIGVISYQRLVKMETGRVIIRESEYELVADALGLDVYDVKLPPLTHSEAIEWNGMWGPRSQIEEGGDEDSVLLAAYVRMLVERTGQRRETLCREMGFPGNCLSRIWHAEKPIDRWPDSTMAAVIRLSGSGNWDDVILNARACHAERTTIGFVMEVMKPRIRYAPEDPDRKAPWTFATDPLRTRKPRREAWTPVSAEPRTETGDERQARERIERREERRRMRAIDEKQLAERFDAVIAEARTGDHHAMLVRLFPDATPRQIEDALRDPRIAADVITRATIIGLTRREYERRVAAKALGVTTGRIRQMVHFGSSIAAYMPKNKTALKRILK